MNYREVFLQLGKPKDQDVVVWKRERVYELLWDCMSDDDRDKLSEFLDATVLQLTPAIPGDLWVDVLVLSGAKRGTVLTTFSFNPEDDHYVDFLGWYGQWLDSVKRKFTDA